MSSHWMQLPFTPRDEAFRATDRQKLLTESGKRGVSPKVSKGGRSLTHDAHTRTQRPLRPTGSCSHSCPTDARVTVTLRFGTKTSICVAVQCVSKTMVLHMTHTGLQVCKNCNNKHNKDNRKVQQWQKTVQKVTKWMKMCEILQPNTGFTRHSFPKWGWGCSHSTSAGSALRMLGLISLLIKPNICQVTV